MLEKGGTTIRIHPPQNAYAAWTNRFLVLSLLGIAALTLFPFRFQFPARLEPQPSFLLFRTWPKDISATDFVLNVLLFVPFGFGIALRTRGKGGGLWASLLLALAAGAILSYSVEFLQLFIPTRDSSWDDVLSNTAGSVAGAVLFRACGNTLLSFASECENGLENWLAPSRAALLLALYFGIWFGASIRLQTQTRLRNWDAGCSLIIGNDASGQHPWKGRVERLEIWDRALPEEWIERRIENVKMSDGSTRDDTGLLASYDFTGAPPFRDSRNFLPMLAWSSSLPPTPRDAQLAMDGRFWLSTNTPVVELTRAITKSNRFTIRILCTPAEDRAASGRIVSLSQSEENVNFHLRQQGSKLVFYFRNPLTETRAMLVWYVDGVFQGGEPRELVASYDGSDAFIYVDGRRVPERYRLGPGVALVHRYSDVIIVDLEGYVIAYEALIFFPAGFLIGIAARGWPRYSTSERFLLAMLFVVPAALLEFLLVWASGRRIWGENIVYSILFCVAGVLLINSDSRSRKNSFPDTSPETK